MSEVETTNVEQRQPEVLAATNGHGEGSPSQAADAPTKSQKGRSKKTLHAPPPEMYYIEKGKTYRWKETPDGWVSTKLANFGAWITEEITLDNGTIPTREFLVEGILHNGGKLPAIRVPASQFATMGWITEQWGAKPTVVAGASTRDHLRAAIQERSQTARQRHVFTHTGWRVINDQWVYLTSTGAIGLGGVEVELDPNLARFALPLVPDDPVGAMKTSLAILTTRSLAVTVPLWAGVYAAPLSSVHPMDLSLWAYGPSGTFKSTFAALAQAHYGPFDRKKLPGSWTSTANSLEQQAHALKDALFTIDDWVPTPADRFQMQRTAERVIRGQGNLAGRGRMRADLTAAPKFAPRGLIMSTGEEKPTGQSLVARMLVIECEKDDVDLPALTAIQDQAHRLPHALAGYIRWLAPQMPTIAPKVRAIFESARARATVANQHRRIPETIACLWIGAELALEYAEEISAVTHEEAERTRAECWDALMTVARAQGRQIEEERPSIRFLRVLMTLRDQDRVIFRLKEDDAPDDREQRGAVMVGWSDKEFYYLMPEAALAAVARFTREADAPFPVSARRLLDDLKREGLSLGCDEERNTATVKVAGKTRRVIKLDVAAVEALLEGISVTNSGDLPVSKPVTERCPAPSGASYAEALGERSPIGSPEDTKFGDRKA